MAVWERFPENLSKTWFGYIDAFPSAVIDDNVFYFLKFEESEIKGSIFVSADRKPDCLGAT